MQFQGSFTIDRKENIHYNLFVSRNRLILMTIIVFVVITAMLGVTNYGQTQSLADAAGRLRAVPSDQRHRVGHARESVLQAEKSV